MTENKPQHSIEFIGRGTMKINCDQPEGTCNHYIQSNRGSFEVRTRDNSYDQHETHSQPIEDRYRRLKIEL